MMHTWHIHIKGQVQGVGFRPFIYRVAQKYNLKGWVNNDVDGVHFVFNANKSLAENCKENIIANAPALSIITEIEIEALELTTFHDFKIKNSAKSGKPNLLLSPDFAICETCTKEILNPKDRRAAYSFTTCTNCGPRYSIIKKLPYDRHRTEMKAFRMCDSCIEEYENPLDRRYYSQTNSCPDCGVEMRLYARNGSLISIDQKNIIDQCVAMWRDGHIVAIKGIGGYLLTCDATNDQTIQTLRRRKYRPSKPLALMASGIHALTSLQLTQQELNALKSPEAPIVLVSKGKLNISKGVAPELSKVGIMLAYTPLLQLALNQFNGLIVASSGNSSGSPIIYEDDNVFNGLGEIADYILLNNRSISIPQDDSVLFYTTKYQQKIITRRSRGLAPTYINPNINLNNESIIAYGAMLKSTFSIQHQENLYVSQYIGDTSDFDSIQNYKSTLKHFKELLNIKEAKILCDIHPHYSTTEMATTNAAMENISLKQIQHHEAHFAAVLAENNLLDTQATILGVIWDGTGWGKDGSIWGGEFFSYRDYSMDRIAHFAKFDNVLGDKMAKEPRISALSCCWNIPAARQLLKQKFTSTEWNIYNTLFRNNSYLLSSSVGRIFDAVASLLGIIDVQTFEGEAAMRMEECAQQYINAKGYNFHHWYCEKEKHRNKIPTTVLMNEIVSDITSGATINFIAAKFHYSLIRIVQTVACKHQINAIAFSGGVFQNGLLVDLSIYYLQADHQLYFHKALSPNDENISFGQIMRHYIQLKKQSIKQRRNTALCV